MINPMIIDFYHKSNKLNNEVKSFKIHDVLKFHNENIAIRDKIDKLNFEELFFSITKDFRGNLVNEFNQNFSVKTAESTDELIDSLDMWYTKLNLPIPKQEITNEKDTVIELPKINYFNYQDIINEK
jgi:hypothetical protein